MEDGENNDVEMNEDSDDEKMEDGPENDSEDEEAEESDDEEETNNNESSEGLSTNGLSTGFDWTASILAQAKEDESSDENEFELSMKYLMKGHRGSFAQVNNILRNDSSSSLFSDISEVSS